MKKIIVISGGSDGLGKEIAKKLAKENQVIILSPTEKKLKKLALEINCDYIVTDVTVWDSVEKATDKIINKYGKIDCLINNAGVWIEGEIDKLKPDEIKRVLEINTLGTIYLTKAVVAQMKKQKSGQIINVISQAGLHAKKEKNVYNATKFALVGFTQSLQLELPPFGIRVTGFYPGKMNTKLFEKAGFFKKMDDAIEPKDAAKIIETLVLFNENVFFPEVGMSHLKGFG